MISSEKLAQLGMTREELRSYLPRIAWRRIAKIEQRGNFLEKYPEDVITAFLVSGRNYFDNEILIARKQELVGFKAFQSFANGQAQLFFPRLPNRRYVIGADVSTGRDMGDDKTDYCAAVVLDVETGEEMAAYHARVTPDELAFDLADLGRYYNSALIAVERTGDGGTTILTLKGECGYPAVYLHREWWKRRQNTRVIEIEGFPSTGKTRPIALNKLQLFVLEHPELIWDVGFIDEAFSFVRNEKGIPAAAPGAHDDRISCRWVAHYVRLVLLGYMDPLKSQSERYASSGQVVIVDSGVTV